MQRADTITIICLALVAVILFLVRKMRQKKKEKEALQEQLSRYQAISDIEVERDRIAGIIATLTSQHQNEEHVFRSLQTQVTSLKTEVTELEEAVNLQTFGFYKPKYDFSTASEYQVKLDSIKQDQKRMLTAGTAATCDTTITINGNAEAGRKQTERVLKLILRAFNGECDGAISKVKYSNVKVMETRIRKSYEAINKLVTSQQCIVAPKYLELRMKELYLVYEHQEKVQAEKEVQRQIREQMREEEIAQRELEKAKNDAEKEEKRYADALQKAQREVEQATGERQQKLLTQIVQLEAQLAQAQQQKQRAISQAQLTRSGHVYVISNIGSFGDDVFKIGMTRRLEPLDRVRELGDASVPFHFDVHAIIYCDDAPKLENTLHHLFHSRRVNRINQRKEFFRVSLAEIAQAVHANHGEIEFLHEAEAREYRQTQNLLIE